MAGEWQETLLGQIVELKRGYDLPQQDRLPGVVPVVSSSGITDHHATAKVGGPGVVTGRYGTLGEVFYIEEDFWPLNTTLYVRDFKGNHPRFISYFLHSVDFLAYSDKAAVPGINRNHLHQARVKCPPLPEQRAIAHILGTLDDKIELNRQMNETLEAMARTLFKSWFVDFDPVRAKAEGRARQDGARSGQPRKPLNVASDLPWPGAEAGAGAEGDPGLPEDIAGLFPDEFEESELGEIPKGWKVGKVGDLAAMYRDTLNPGDFPEEVFDHYSIPAFDEGRIPKAEMGDTIKSNKFTVLAGCVLLSKLNPRIPRVWLPDLRGPRRAICSTEFLVVLPGGDTSREFLFCLFTSAEFTTAFSTLVTGTSGSHQRVKPESLLEMDAIIPPEPAIRQFTAATSPLFSLVIQNIDQSRPLAALRDTLLPKLISGELRIPDAAQFVRRCP